jgi:small acid-soluble spore protein F (minor alpha/beta-type SASP)
LGRRRGIMSDRFKEELAKELGFYDVVQKEGWGAIRARDAGNMVKRAIEIAEQQLVQNMNQQQGQQR